MIALIAGLILDGLDAIAGVALPWLMRGGIDHGIETKAFHVIILVSAAALAIVLADWVVNAVQTVVVGRNGERLLYTLRVKIFAQLQRLGLDFYEREMTGRIMTRMTTDVDAMSTFLQTGLITMVNSALTFIGVLVALLLINVRLGLILFTVLPVLVVATVWFRVKSAKAYAEAREKVSVVNADLQENVAGLRVAQAYRREQVNHAKFAGLSSAYRRSRMRAQRYISLYFPFVQALSTIAGALILFTAASEVHSGILTAGGLIAYLLYIDMLFAPIQQMSQVFDGYQQASVGVDRISSLMRIQTSTPEAEHPIQAGRLRGEVELDDVHFKYRPDSAEAIRGVSLRIAPGETVAFVGQTGARQVHPGQAHRQVLRRDRGPGPDRRRRRPVLRAVQLPPPPRRRAPGAVPVPRHAQGRDRLRPPGRLGRRGRGRRPRRGRDRDDRETPWRLLPRGQ